MYSVNFLIQLTLVYYTLIYIAIFLNIFVDISLPFFINYYWYSSIRSSVKTCQKANQ
jgi:hypothetical protein